MYTGSDNVSVTFNVDENVYNSTYNIRTVEMFTLWYKVNGKTYKGTRVSNTLVDGIGIIVFSMDTVENGNYMFRVELSNGLLEGSSTRTKRVAAGAIIKTAVEEVLTIDKSTSTSGVIGEVEGWLALKCFPCDASGTILTSSESMTIAKSGGSVVQESSIWSHYIVKTISPAYGTILDNQVTGTVDIAVTDVNNANAFAFNVGLNTVFTLSSVAHATWTSNVVRLRAARNYVGSNSYATVSYSADQVVTNVAYINI